MNVYQPAEGVYVGRPPCGLCGAAYRLHRSSGGWPGACPEAWRPESLERAQRELAAAQASGDTAAEFIARGDVQRLGGRP